MCVRRDCLDLPQPYRPLDNVSEPHDYNDTDHEGPKPLPLLSGTLIFFRNTRTYQASASFTVAKIKFDSQ